MMLLYVTPFSPSRNMSSSSTRKRWTLCMLDVFVYTTKVFDRNISYSIILKSHHQPSLWRPKTNDESSMRRHKSSTRIYSTICFCLMGFDTIVWVWCFDNWMYSAIYMCCAFVLTQAKCLDIVICHNSNLHYSQVTLWHHQRSEHDICFH